MARLANYGLETNDTTLVGTWGDTRVYLDLAPLNSSTTIQGVAKRSGNYAGKCDSGVGNIAAQFRAIWTTTAPSLGTVLYARAYVYFDNLSPSADIPVVSLWNIPVLSERAGVRLRSSDSKLELYYLDSGGSRAAVGSPSAALSTGQWYCVELSLTINTGGTDAVEFRLDGTSVASGSSLTILSDNHANAILAGWTEAPGASKVMYVDDVIVNDNSGSDQNSWPGIDEKLVLSLPISDNARDTLWTGGAGGTTSLFEAVNNTPPVGTATETNTTQIEHAGGAAGTTDRYDADMTKYSDLGIASGDTINVMEFIDVDGEDIATGSKLLNFEVLSNPVMASPGNVTAGDNIGALGTYPTGWAIHRSAMTYNPSVTVTTSPVMRARRPETASRVASVCFMGIYIGYTPAAAPDTSARKFQKASVLGV